MENESLVIQEDKNPENVKFSLIGRVDSLNADQLQLKLDEVQREGCFNIILNMARVEYLCSIGIRVILKAYKDAKKMGGRLGIEFPSECVKKVLYITTLNELLMI